MRVTARVCRKGGARETCRMRLPMAQGALSGSILSTCELDTIMVVGLEKTASSSICSPDSCSACSTILACRRSEGGGCASRALKMEHWLSTLGSLQRSGGVRQLVCGLQQEGVEEGEPLKAREDARRGEEDEQREQGEHEAVDRRPRVSRAERRRRDQRQVIHWRERRRQLRRQRQLRWQRQLRRRNGRRLVESSA